MKVLGTPSLFQPQTAGTYLLFHALLGPNIQHRFPLTTSLGSPTAGFIEVHAACINLSCSVALFFALFLVAASLKMVFPKKGSYSIMLVPKPLGFGHCSVESSRSA